MADIHGNRHALEAVIADATAAGVDRWWVLGDLAAIGPEPARAHDLAGGGADVVVAGHTHRPTDRVVGRVRAVNPGSVGNPVTPDLRAAYAILHADRHGHRVEHRRVAYDRDAFLASVARSGHPAAAYIASFPHDSGR